MCGLSNASLVFSLASFRGLAVVPGADTTFRVLFPDLEESQTVQIEGETDLYQGDSRLALEIAGTTAVIGAEPTTELRARLVGVEFRARSRSGEYKGQVRWAPALVGPSAAVLDLGPVRVESFPGVTVESPSNPDVLSARYVRPQPHAVMAEVHALLTDLVKQRAVDRVLNLVRLVEPSVRGIHPLVERGQPTIYVETEKQNLFPVQIMGGGFVNILQLATFMCDDISQLILVDEIEDGLHYSVLSRLAQSLLTLAQERGKQFMIATHSRDVLLAFGEEARTRPNLVAFLKLSRQRERIAVTRFDTNEWLRIEEIGGEIR